VHTFFPDCGEEAAGLAVFAHLPLSEELSVRTQKTEVVNSLYHWNVVALQYGIQRGRKQWENIVHMGDVRIMVLQKIHECTTSLDVEGYLEIGKALVKG
jgi:hypothetical protein